MVNEAVAKSFPVIAKTVEVVCIAERLNLLTCVVYKMFLFDAFIINSYYNCNVQVTFVALKKNI